MAFGNSADRKAEEMLRRKTNLKMMMAPINEKKKLTKIKRATERRKPLEYSTEGAVATNSGIGFERFERVDFARVESNYNSLDNFAT